MAGLVPAISIRRALCSPHRDARPKAGHDAEIAVQANRKSRYSPDSMACRSWKRIAPLLPLSAITKRTGPCPEMLV